MPTDSDRDQRPPWAFWRTLPGLVGAIAALLTAATGLMTFLYTVGPLSSSSSSATDTTLSSSPTVTPAIPDAPSRGQANSASSADSPDSTLSQPVVTGPRSLEMIVEPGIARNFVNAQHFVYVTLRDLMGNLMVGDVVKLKITEGPHRGLTKDATTDDNGQAVFEYTGTKTGTDVIQVWTDAETFETAPRGASGQVTHDWF